DQWWQTFAGNTKRITDLFCRKAEWDLPQWMEDHLQAIHPQLMWEYGTGLSGVGHRLVITPESARHLRPLTDTVLQRAPRLEGWEFYGYRPPEGLEETQATVEGRTGGSIDGIMFEAHIGDRHLIDLTFLFPRELGEEDDQATHEAFVAAETL